AAPAPASLRSGAGGEGGVPPGGALPESAATAPVRPDDGPAPAYRLPPLDLLPRPGRSRQGRAVRDTEQKRRLLEETLRNFGVEARVLAVHHGPAVTRFEVQPAPGVKVSRIVGLADDIALSLAAPDVRIVAPIPGKAAVGIEVPNAQVSPVFLRDVLESEAFRNSSSPLTVAVGQDIAGQPVVARLDRMLHLLIAGATGSGKSVCINSLICSILFKARPDEVRFLLIDPKVVELSQYNGIPHLLVPVVTDPKRAAGCLRWLLKEMEARYRAFADAGVRDIAQFNAAVTGAAAGGSPERAPYPYIVVVIDELADLMMVAPGEVEDAIQRLAQMARAAGIHLVVATQRPSVDVITGVIKANIPSRIAFAVSSQVDSRTILDAAGAEKLVGRGDMLFHPMGAPKPFRVQGAFIGEAELEALLAFVRRSGEPDYREEVMAEEVVSNRDGASGEDDRLLAEAARVVLEAGQASVSLLQRRLRVGYARAGRLMDLLEERGFVGPHQGSKPREILLTPEAYRRIFGGGPSHTSGADRH
ncbi:MAG: DNA translocase FtsK, partial [Clostridia bacterium]|nr:DNA translocase FtsK [Clostridia bacterium]